MVSRQTQLQVAFANAQALQEEGRFAEAERAWLDLEKDIPSHAGVLVNLAMAQWQLGALEKAEGTAARAIGVGPEMEQAHAIYAVMVQAHLRVLVVCAEHVLELMKIMMEHLMIHSHKMKVIV